MADDRRLTHLEGFVVALFEVGPLAGWEAVLPGIGIWPPSSGAVPHSVVHALIVGFG